MGSLDSSELFDAIYAVELPLRDWLLGVLSILYRELDQGAGVGSVLYRAQEGRPLLVHAIGGIAVSEQWIIEGLDIFKTPEMSQAAAGALRVVRCADLKALFFDPLIFKSVQSRFRSHGVEGSLIINGWDASGLGCALHVFTLRSVQPSKAQRRAYEVAARHLSRAYRLQRRLSMLEHATLLGARFPNALPASDWRNIEQREHGGDRYLVLGASPALNPLRSALSPRESQVISLAAAGMSNKVIAAELGISHSTVRVLQARAKARRSEPPPTNVPAFVWELAPGSLCDSC